MHMFLFVDQELYCEVLCGCAWGVWGCVCVYVGVCVCVCVCVYVCVLACVLF